MPSIEELIGRKQCCPQDTGGSHYHCGRCNGVSSMMGHYRSVHWVKDPNGGKTKTIQTVGHHCCPDDCELEALQSEPESGTIAVWRR